MFESVQKISEISGDFTGYLNPDDVLGFSLAAIGDINGDGIGDLAVGSPRNDDGAWESGAVYIFCLNSNGTVKSQQKISNYAGNFNVNLRPGDIFGGSMTGMGDLDGDGIPDLAVSAYLADDGGFDRGAFYVLYMNTNGTVKSSQKVSSTSGNFTGSLDNDDAFGRSLANIGDIDGDGVIELAVGARSDDDGGFDRGAIYILYMNSNGTVKQEQKISNTVGNFTASLHDNDQFGSSATAIGDLDGDGIKELAVGAHLDDDGGENRGAVYILFLNSNGTVRSHQKISALAGNFTAPLDNDDNFGWSVSALGDFDRDGIADIAVGAFKDDDGGTDRGAVYFLLLNSDGTVKSSQKVSDTQGGFTGQLENNDQFGTSIALLGDLNGNGTSEIAVGAFLDDDGGSDKGAVYLLFPTNPNQSPIAADDAVVTDEESILTGNVLVDNGYGADSDPNGDTLTIVAVNGSTVNVGQTVTLASGALLTLNANGTFNYNPNGQFDYVTPGYSIPVTDSFNYTIGDGHGETSQGNVIITVNGVNDAPTIDDQSFQLDENSAVGTYFGRLVASDLDRYDALNYRSVSDSQKIFAVSRSGDIYVINEPLNYEVKSFYTLTIEVRDNENSIDTAIITIALNNINDAPVIHHQSFYIDENSLNGTAIDTVIATDEDATSSLTYSIIGGNESGAFVINSATGVIHVVSHLNYEVRDRYTLTVGVTDNGTPQLTDTATITININDLNEAPVIDDRTDISRLGGDLPIRVLSFNIDENSANGTVVGTVVATDEDLGQSLTYSIIGGNESGAFEIDSATGVVKVKDVNQLNYEVRDRHTLTVRVTDNGTGHLTDTATFTIDINDLNETPIFIELPMFSIDENSNDGTFIGAAEALDEDFNQSLTYTLIGGDGNGIFTINQATGSITIAGNIAPSSLSMFLSTMVASNLAGATLDYETDDTYSLTLQVTDNGIGQLSSTTTVIIQINDVNEAPIIDVQDFQVDENRAYGTLIGTIVASDEDQGQTLTYSILNGNNNGVFAINPTTGEISVNDSRYLNYELADRYTLTVQVSDNATNPLTDTASITINLNDINEAPVLNDYHFNIDENRPLNTLVGTVVATNEDNGQQLTYSIVNGNNNGLFVINSTTGAVKVANNAQLNYELLSSHTLTVQVTDNGSNQLTDVATVIIDVNNVNDAPVVGNLAFNLLDGSTPLSGSFTVTDEDANDAVIFSILSNPQGGLSNNNGNGTFTYNLGTDFRDLAAGETRTVNFTYRATDSHWASNNTGTVSITVTGINNNPIVGDITLTASEDGTAVTGLFGGDDIDSDDTPQSLTYLLLANPSEGSITPGSNRTFTFNPGSHFQDLAAGETRQLNLSYTATDSHGASSNAGSLLINVLGTNDNPIVSHLNLMAFEDDGELIASFVGDDVDSDDAPNTLTYTLTSTPSYGSVANNNDGTFNFNLGNSFDDLSVNESRNVAFTYIATDSQSGVSNTASVTITVWGVNNTYVGSDGNNLIVGNDSRDLINGQAGDDVIYGYRGNGVSGVNGNAISPTIDTSPLSDGDLLKGGSGNDTLYGGNGNDELYGGNNADWLWGGNGNDTLKGDGGNDRLIGGEGNDLYLWNVGNGKDIYSDSNGFDTLQVISGDLTLQQNFDSSTGIDQITGAGTTTILGNSDGDSWNFQGMTLSGIAVIDGYYGNDSLSGSSGNDKLSGNNGHDTLKGNDGNDTLNGGTGNDSLWGGGGNDILTGGDGNDRFVFNATGEGVDTLTDFNSSKDSIVVSASGFGGGLTVGGITAAQLTFGITSTSANQRFIHNIVTGDLYFDADGNTAGGSSQVLFAKLPFLSLLSYRNISVI